MQEEDYIETSGVMIWQVPAGYFYSIHIHNDVGARHVEVNVSAWEEMKIFGFVSFVYENQSFFYFYGILHVSNFHTDPVLVSVILP